MGSHSIRCPTCERLAEAQWRTAPECSRCANARRSYGADGLAVLLAFDGRCDMCGVQTDKPYIDHDHATGRVRGAVCNRCNTYEGYVRARRERGVVICDSELDAYLERSA